MLGGLLVYLDTLMMLLWLVMMYKEKYPLELPLKTETTLNHQGLRFAFRFAFKCQ